MAGVSHLFLQGPNMSLKFFSAPTSLSIKTYRQTIRHSTKLSGQSGILTRVAAAAPTPKR